jgi:hypothetical protein
MAACLYQHAIGIMRAHPELTGVGVAVGTLHGKVTLLACGVTIPDRHGRPVTPERLQAAREREGNDLVIVVAALRVCQTAHFEMAKLYAPAGEPE